jgi:hypothetical protein
MKAEFEDWGLKLKGYQEFMELLNQLSNINPELHCRNGSCGTPDCAIRKCAKEKNLVACAFCEEYPCELITSFAESEGTLLYDGERLKKIGLEKWIKEQETRKKENFCYSDVRQGKSFVPREE